jgi:gallate dioxygenase
MTRKSGTEQKSYIFDLELSAKALRLNRFLHALTVPSHRELFARDPDKAMQSLSEEEKRMVRDLDWKALMDYGASFFCLEKLARAKGVSNPQMVAAFRGETLEEFLKTRRVPGAR